VGDSVAVKLGFDCLAASKRTWATDLVIHPDEIHCTFVLDLKMAGQIS
jgi:hypothetical protein